MRMLTVNIFNTIKTLTLAKEQGSKKYFCVSTDKAANPVNMMGASKQIMEMFLMRESTSMSVSMARLQMLPFLMVPYCMALINALLKDSPFLRQMMLEDILLHPKNQENFASCQDFLVAIETYFFLS